MEPFMPSPFMPRTLVMDRYVTHKKQLRGLVKESPKPPPSEVYCKTKISKSLDSVRSHFTECYRDIPSSSLSHFVGAPHTVSRRHIFRARKNVLHDTSANLRRLHTCQTVYDTPIPNEAVGHWEKYSPERRDIRSGWATRQWVSHIRNGFNLDGVEQDDGLVTEDDGPGFLAAFDEADDGSTFLTASRNAPRLLISAPTRTASDDRPPFDSQMAITNVSSVSTDATSDAIAIGSLSPTSTEARSPSSHTFLRPRRHSQAPTSPVSDGGPRSQSPPPPQMLSPSRPRRNSRPPSTPGGEFPLAFPRPDTSDTPSSRRPSFQGRSPRMPTLLQRRQQPNTSSPTPLSHHLQARMLERLATPKSPSVHLGEEATTPMSTVSPSKKKRFKRVKAKLATPVKITAPVEDGDDVDGLPPIPNTASDHVRPWSATSQGISEMGGSQTQTPSHQNAPPNSGGGPRILLSVETPTEAIASALSKPSLAGHDSDTVTPISTRMVTTSRTRGKTSSRSTGPLSKSETGRLSAATKRSEDDEEDHQQATQAVRPSVQFGSIIDYRVLGASVRLGGAVYGEQPGLIHIEDSSEEQLLYTLGQRGKCPGFEMTRRDIFNLQAKSHFGLSELDCLAYCFKNLVGSEDRMTFRQFDSLSWYCKELGKGAVERLFMVFDVSGNSRLSFEDFAIGLGLLFKASCDDHAHLIFKFLDRNRKRAINYKDLLELICRTADDLFDLSQLCKALMFLILGKEGRVSESAFKEAMNADACPLVDLVEPFVPILPLSLLQDPSAPSAAVAGENKMRRKIRHGESVRGRRPSIVKASANGPTKFTLDYLLRMWQFVQSKGRQHGITVGEFRSVLLTEFGIDNAQQSGALFTLLDARFKCEGYMDYRSLLSALHFYMRGVIHDKTRVMFTVFSSSGDGSLTFAEFKEAVSASRGFLGQTRAVELANRMCNAIYEGCNLSLSDPITLPVFLDLCAQRSHFHTVFIPKLPVL